MKIAEVRRLIDNYSVEQLKLTIALLYKGNLWFMDITTVTSVQITGDGLISVMDWK